MSIVVITIDEEPKREFVNSLHAKTGGAVALVIIQKKPPVPFWQRIKRFFKKNNNLRSIYYAVLLLINTPIRRRLAYFRYRTRKAQGTVNWAPPVMYVTCVNDDTVHQALLKISPPLLVVWGSGILKKHIVQTAQQVINLHLGYAPYYRGAVGNQFAVYNDDIAHIGATLHHVSPEADSGDIIETILSDTSRPPRELFRTLNDAAEERFTDVAIRLHKGENLPRKPQNRSEGSIYLLKQWTPEIRYKVGKKILQWEKRS